MFGIFLLLVNVATIVVGAVSETTPGKEDVQDQIPCS